MTIARVCPYCRTRYTGTRCPCRGPKRQGSTEWKRVRKVVFARDGHRCRAIDDETGQRCTMTTTLELSHLVPHRKGGLDVETNLVCLCHRHHMLLDHGSK
jgi:5-methylcytosine-specific restriction endonuclease McrA